MKSLDILIEMGFNLSVLDGNVKLEYRGSNPLDIAKAKTLIEELKHSKEQAIDYLKGIIIYDLSLGDNFAFQVQSCLNSQYDNNIRWLRCDVYQKSKRLVLVGVIKKPEHIAMWHDLEKEHELYQENPFIKAAVQ